MSDWYYTTGGDQRHGPIPTDDLVARFRSGQISLDTLVWRDGQSQWQPLADFAEAVGLKQGDTLLPPPLPPTHPRPQAGFATPAYTARPTSAPPKSGLSGCLIAVIVCALLAIPVAAILAAIALPAYQDYTQRAKVASALPLAEPLKLAVAEHFDQHQACPGNDDSGFGPPEGYASGLVAAATVGTFESDRCGIELRLTVPGNDRLDGKAVWFEYDPSTTAWQCSSEIDDKYLPSTCRG